MEDIEPLNDIQIEELDAEDVSDEQTHVNSKSNLSIDNKSHE